VAVAGNRVDDLDRKIIELLQANGRASNTQIAAELGVTESTVRKRIDRLLIDDIMKITAVVNPLELDYPIVAIFGMNVVPQRIKAIGEELARFTEFRFIGVTVGAWDFITEGWFTSIGEMHAFLNDRLWPLEGVNRIEISHVINMVRYAYDWGVGMDANQSPVKIGGERRST
jgi:Lrp/AsnC family transcriptional regulator for asnA, asnC and gidA